MLATKQEYLWDSSRLFVPFRAFSSLSFDTPEGQNVAVSALSKRRIERTSVTVLLVIDPRTCFPSVRFPRLFSPSLASSSFCFFDRFGNPSFS